MTDEANRPKAASPAGSTQGAASSPRPASPPGAAGAAAQPLAKPSGAVAKSELAKAEASIGRAKVPEAKSAKGPHVRGAGVAAVVAGVFGVAATIAAVSTVPDARTGGAAAIAGIALGVSSLVFGLVALVSRRKLPRKLGVPAIAAIIGAVACASSGLLALRARTPERLLDEPPALGAWRTGEAQARAHLGALFGLAGIPGAFVGGLGVWLGVRARKKGRAAAPPANLGVESVPLAWTALSGVAIASIAGIGVDAYAITAQVARVEHPHARELHAIGEAMQRSDVPTACNSLEIALAPDFVPSEVLERELPSYREIAHRCLTLRIDALPKGIACAIQAGKLLGSPLVAAVNAEDRVNHACDGPL